MMKNSMLLVLLLSLIVCVKGQQKLLIDTGMLGTWPYIDEGGIILSGDGHYAAYIVYNQPVGKQTVTIQDLRGTWKKEIPCSNARLLFFTSDNRQLCWLQRDSIWLQKADSDQTNLLGVNSGLSFPSESQGTWMVLPGNKTDSNFRLVNLVTGHERIFASVKKHCWLDGGQKLLLCIAEERCKFIDLKTTEVHHFDGVREVTLSPDNKTMLLLTSKDSLQSLQWVSSNTSRPVTIWTGLPGEELARCVFDKAGNQLTFSVQCLGKKIAIWYYKATQKDAMRKVSDETVPIIGDLRILGSAWFSDNGRWLLFTVGQKISALPSEKVVTSLDIWSYRDEVLNPAQSAQRRAFSSKIAILDISNNTVKLLQQQDDETLILIVGNHAILATGINSAGPWWPHNGLRSWWLVSLEDGKRTLMWQYAPGFEREIMKFSVSPNGRWICFWDPESANYFSIEPQTGRIVNLTAKLPVSMADAVPQLIHALPVGIAGWEVADSALLVYDDFDIWRLDPSGIKVPINVTGGYGRQYGVKLRFVYNGRNGLRSTREELLSGYDVISKYNGFFSINLNKPGPPQLLTMGPFNYYQQTVFDDAFSNGMQPLSGGKGRNKRWVVMRQSAEEYPNFFVSKDLKKFEPLTNLHPQYSYNWLITEPINWRMYNGQLNTGILYKPENFDSTQKYPIIINYYQKMSHRCYQFPRPGLTKENINIPWFVSRGYLVFTPDIQYTVASSRDGKTIGEAAYNAVASGAEYLAIRSYVDKKRMAIQGHSFGGHETNAIIMQTNLFAAAAEMAGNSDDVSAYLTLVPSSEGGDLIEKNDRIDHFQQRMRATLWERPDLFRTNSPVLHADKIETPLLIVHNKRDGAVNFRQGVEMYLAMRRLGKPCWLLQYDSSGHTLRNKSDALDHTIRLTQYFDHYLKGTPAPQWMTMSLLAGYKRRNNLYSLDTLGNCSSKCLVCKRWNNID